VGEGWDDGMRGKVGGESTFDTVALYTATAREHYYNAPFIICDGFRGVKLWPTQPLCCICWLLTVVSRM